MKNVLTKNNQGKFCTPMDFNGAAIVNMTRMERKRMAMPMIANNANSPAGCALRAFRKTGCSFSAVVL